jgi:hypothetical protein
MAKADVTPGVLATPFEIDAQSRAICVLNRQEELDALTVMVKRALYGSETHQLDVTACMRDLGSACMSVDMPVNTYVGLDPLPGVPKKMWVVAEVLGKHAVDCEWVFLVKEHGNRWHYPVIVFEQKNRSYSSSVSVSSSSSSSSSSGSSSSLESAGACRTPRSACDATATRALEGKDEKRSGPSGGSATSGLGTKSGAGGGGESKGRLESKKAETRSATPGSDVALQQALAQSLLDVKRGARREVPRKDAVYVLGSPHDTALWTQVDRRALGLLKDTDRAHIGSLYASEHSSSHLANLRSVPKEAPLVVAFGGLQTSRQLEAWLQDDSSSFLLLDSKSATSDSAPTPIADGTGASGDSGTAAPLTDFEAVAQAKIDRYFAWIAQLMVERGSTRIAVSSFLPVTQLAAFVPSLSSLSSLSSAAPPSPKQLARTTTHRLRTINSMLAKRCHELGLFYLDVFAVIEAAPRNQPRFAHAAILLQIKLDQFVDFCQPA